MLCVCVPVVPFLPFLTTYDFSRSPWRLFSASRRPGNPLHSPSLDVMAAVDGRNHVPKAHTVLCPCLLPWETRYARAEPLPNPSNRSLVQEHVRAVAGLLVRVSTPEELQFSWLQRSCKFCCHQTSHRVEERTPTVQEQHTWLGDASLETFGQPMTHCRSEGRCSSWLLYSPARHPLPTHPRPLPRPATLMSGRAKGNETHMLTKACTPNVKRLSHQSETDRCESLLYI